MVKCSYKRKRSCKQTKSCKWSKKTSSCKRRRSPRKSPRKTGTRGLSSEAKLLSEARAILAYAQIAQATSASPSYASSGPSTSPSRGFSAADMKAYYRAQAQEAKQQKEKIRQQLRKQQSANVEEEAGSGDFSPIFGGGRHHYGHYIRGGSYF
jgi:hypothetical protein